MTKMPEMLHDLIRVNFDGTFHEPKSNGGLPPLGHDFYPDIRDSHRE